MVGCSCWLAVEHFAAQFSLFQFAFTRHRGKMEQYFANIFGSNLNFMALTFRRNSDLIVNFSAQSNIVPTTLTLVKAYLGLFASVSLLVICIFTNFNNCFSYYSASKLLQFPAPPSNSRGTLHSVEASICMEWMPFGTLWTFVLYFTSSTEMGGGLSPMAFSRRTRPQLS